MVSSSPMYISLHINITKFGPNSTVIFYGHPAFEHTNVTLTYRKLIVLHFETKFAPFFVNYRARKLVLKL